MSPRHATNELIRQVLKHDYLSLVIEKYTMTEVVAEGTPCQVDVTLRHKDKPEERVTIEGAGLGFLDATYKGLMAHYAQAYQSLNTIKFTGFSVTGEMETGSRLGADAEAKVELTVVNSDNRKFEFVAKRRSMIAASMDVVIEAIEHFANSESAFIAVYKALTDARNRGRADLIESYTSQLAELVNTTSYTAVIDQIKEEMLGR